MYLRCLDKNSITITAGNSAVIDITPIDEASGLPIRLTADDKVIFTISTRLGKTKLQKTLTNEDYSDPEDTSLNCVINPEDTIDWYPDCYIYDCLLITPEEAVTFINSTFVVEEALGKYTDGG